FQKRGVAAQPLHSGQSTDIQAGVLADFKAGRLPVLINVAKMTHGVDVPDIRTIFLARPTTSETLFAQMIGRGARKIPGKDFFFIVDFVDNMTLHGANVIRAANVIGSVSRGAALAAHSIKAAPIEQVRHIPGYEELQGLEVQPNQTFGIEFELTCKGFELMNHGDWMHRAEIIRSALASVVPTAAAAVQSCSTPSDQKHLWAVKYDASCGFEVTSRVLVGAGGFAEVIDACRVLQDAAQTAGLSVSVKTGTHIHLAWLRDFEAVRRLYLLATYYEPAIASIISPSRVTSMYAKPLRKHLTGVLWACDLRAWPTQGLRYLGLNATSLFHSHGTIEVRWHGGTLDAGKILTWLSLWMCLLTKAQSSGPPADPRARVSSRPLCVGPRGDVNELAKFLGLKVELRDRLVARRAHLLETQWSRGPLARVAQRVSRRWNATEWSRGGRTRERRP
ncbi:MAG TPA: amidoligase family protein, partial [Polyangiaceae bacterium]|nr:amidoligase family protein [Polyangiaceae bacterium]